MAGAVALGCNAIVGVADVKPKRATLDNDTGTSGKSSTSGSNGSNGTSGAVEADDDDDTQQKPDSGGTGVGSGKEECAGKVDCERYVFVTKATFTGKLGGASGADQKCVDAAKANPKLAGRAFRAWLSEQGVTAASRIEPTKRMPHGTKKYMRPDGSTLATSWTDLTDGSLNLPFSLDENGAELPGSTFERSVWTGTDQTGAWDALGDTCSDWFADTVTASGSFGDSQVTDTNWSELEGEPVALSSCNAEKHIYCIEY